MMHFHSKWDIDYSTKRFRQTRNIEELSYQVTTRERFKCRFSPAPKGVHAYENDSSNSENIFGTVGLDESMHDEGCVCHATLDENIPSEADKHIQFAGVDGADVSDNRNRNRGVSDASIT